VRQAEKTVSGSQSSPDGIKRFAGALEPDIREGRFGLCDSEKCYEAVEELGKIGDAAIPYIVKLLPVSSFAHSALARIRGDRVLQILCQELNSPSWERKAAAAQALGQMGDAHALEPLKSAQVAIASCDVITVHRAVERAISHLERAQGDTFFCVDKEDPYGCVQKIWDENRAIVLDKAARQKAIEWYRCFVGTMPELQFRSDFDRAHTWFCLGVIIFRLSNPEPHGLNAMEVDGPCAEAALCLRKSMECLPEKDKHRLLAAAAFLRRAEQRGENGN
jgi:hypothetical protein